MKHIVTIVLTFCMFFLMSCTEKKLSITEKTTQLIEKSEKESSSTGVSDGKIQDLIIELYSWGDTLLLELEFTEKGIKRSELANNKSRISKQGAKLEKRLVSVPTEIKLWGISPIALMEDSVKDLQSLTQDIRLDSTMSDTLAELRLDSISDEVIRMSGEIAVLKKVESEKKDSYKRIRNAKLAEEAAVKRRKASSSWFSRNWLWFTPVFLLILALFGFFGVYLYSRYSSSRTPVWVTTATAAISATVLSIKTVGVWSYLWSFLRKIFLFKLINDHVYRPWLKNLLKSLVVLFLFTLFVVFIIPDSWKNWIIDLFSGFSFTWSWGSVVMALLLISFFPLLIYLFYTKRYRYAIGSLAVLLIGCSLWIYWGDISSFWNNPEEKMIVEDKELEPAPKKDLPVVEEPEGVEEELEEEVVEKKKKKKKSKKPKSKTESKPKTKKKTKRKKRLFPDDPTPAKPGSVDSYADSNHETLDGYDIGSPKRETDKIRVIN